MKISTKTRYGLRAMIYLAQKEKDEYCPLKEIADSQEISFDYLEKIIAELREESLVESHRGVQGGYCLSKTASQIKVGEIIRALEGNNLVNCISEEGSCPQADNCLAKKVWKKLQEEINKSLDSITLKDLIK